MTTSEKKEAIAKALFQLSMSEVAFHYSQTDQCKHKYFLEIEFWRKEVKFLESK